MKSFTVYRSSRSGVLECAAFLDGTMILHTLMQKESTNNVRISTANIKLKSQYDVEQTLIPGVTRRAVVYEETGMTFAQIKWNRDESYTIDLGDESFDVVRDSAQSFTFKKGEETVGSIGRYPGNSSVITDSQVRYEPSYTVHYDEGLSQKALIVFLTFPVLYFGF